MRASKRQHHPRLSSPPSARVQKSVIHDHTTCGFDGRFASASCSSWVSPASVQSRGRHRTTPPWSAPRLDERSMARRRQVRPLAPMERVPGSAARPARGRGGRPFRLAPRVRSQPWVRSQPCGPSWSAARTTRFDRTESPCLRGGTEDQRRCEHDYQ